MRTSWRRCLEEYPALIFDINQYRKFFQCETDKQFYTFDQGGRGRISALLVYATLMALCKADVNEKVRFAFGLFDYKNVGRNSLRREELVMLMQATMRGICIVKKMAEPEFDAYVEQVEEYCAFARLPPTEDIQLESFLVWFKKDAQRVGVIDTNLKNLARLGNLISRQRGLLDQAASLVKELEAEGAKDVEWTIDLGRKAFKAFRKAAEQEAKQKAKKYLDDEGEPDPDASDGSSSSESSEGEMVEVKRRVRSRRPEPRGLRALFDWQTRTDYDALEEVASRVRAASSANSSSDEGTHRRPRRGSGASAGSGTAGSGKRRGSAVRAVEGVGQVSLGAAGAGEPGGGGGGAPDDSKQSESGLAMDAFFEEMERSKKEAEVDPELEAAAAAAEAKGRELLGTLEFPLVMSLASHYMCELTDAQLVHATETLRRAARLPKRNVKYYYDRWQANYDEWVAEVEAIAKEKEQREAQRKAELEAAEERQRLIEAGELLEDEDSDGKGVEDASISRPGSATGGRPARPSTAVSRKSRVSGATENTASSYETADLTEEQIAKLAERAKVEKMIRRNEERRELIAAQRWVQERFDEGVKRTFEHWLSRVVVYSTATGIWQKWFISSRVYGRRLFREVKAALTPFRGSAPSLGARVARLRYRAEAAQREEAARLEARRQELAEETERKNAMARRKSSTAIALLSGGMAALANLPEEEEPEKEEEPVLTAAEIEAQKAEEAAERTARIVLDIEVDGGGLVFERYASRQLEAKWEAEAAARAKALEEPESFADGSERPTTGMTMFTREMDPFPGGDSRTLDPSAVASAVLSPTARGLMAAEPKLDAVDEERVETKAEKASRRSRVLGRKPQMMIGENELNEGQVKRALQVGTAAVTAEGVELAPELMSPGPGSPVRRFPPSPVRRDTAGGATADGGATVATSSPTTARAGTVASSFPGGVDSPTADVRARDAGDEGDVGDHGGEDEQATASDKRYAVLFSTQRRFEMPAAPVIIEGGRKMSMPKIKVKKKKSAKKLTAAEQLSNQLDVSNPFGAQKSVAEIEELRARAAAGGNTAAALAKRKRARQRPPKPKKKPKAQTAKRKAAAKGQSVRRKRPKVHPFKGFISFDLTAKKDTTLRQLRDVAAALDRFLEVPFVKEKLTWLFEAKSIRIVTEAGVSAVRVFLFRKADILGDILDWLGHPFNDLLSGKYGSIKTRFDLGVSEEAIETIKLYKGWRRALIHGRSGRKLTEFGRNAIADLLELFDSNLDGVLTLGEFNRLQALNGYGITRLLADVPLPSPLHNPPEGSIEAFNNSFRFAHRDLKTICALLKRLEGPNIVIREVTAHAPKKMGMGDIVAALRGMDKSRERSDRRRQQQIDEQMQAFREQFVTRSPFLPALVDRKALVEALARENIVADEEGTITKDSVGGAYGKCVSGTVVNVEDGAPAGDGDKGYELAMDIRQMALGSLDQYLRCRAAVIAELPLVYLKQVDEDLQMILEEMEASGVCIDGSDEKVDLDELLGPAKKKDAMPASISIAITPGGLKEDDGTNESGAGVGKPERELSAYEQWKVRTWKPPHYPAPREATGDRFRTDGHLAFFLLQAIKGARVGLTYDRLSDLIPRHLLPNWMTSPGRAVSFLSKIPVAAADWYNHLREREKELDRQARLAARRGAEGRVKWQPAPDRDPAVSDSDDEEATEAWPERAFTGWAGQRVEDIIREVLDEFSPPKGTKSVLHAAVYWARMPHRSPSLAHTFVALQHITQREPRRRRRRRKRPDVAGVSARRTSSRSTSSACAKSSRPKWRAAASSTRSASS